MTISSQTRKAGPFVGNGTVATFPFTFKVFQASDLQLVKLNSTTNVETQLVLTTDYTVSLNANQNTNPGGTITLMAGVLPTGYKLTITTNIAPLQAADLTNSGGFYPSVINAALDKLTILVQQIIERAGRTLTLPLSTPTDVSTSLPAPQANNFIGWDQTGKALQNYDNQSLATVVAYGTAKGDIFTGDGSTAQFNLSNNPGALNNLDVSVGGVTQLPGADYSWNGGTLVTFTSPPPSGEKVFVRYMQGLPFGTVQGVDVVGGVLWADTIAGFDASSVIDGTLVVFSGRDTVGDGGGGPFRYSISSTQTADDVIVFTPSGGGRLLRDGYTVLGFNGELQLRWAGVKLDGVTNDTLAVQRAITAAVANKCTIRAPHGKCVVSSTLTAPETLQFCGEDVQSRGGNNTPASTPTGFVIDWAGSDSAPVFMVDHYTTKFALLTNITVQVPNTYAGKVFHFKGSRYFSQGWTYKHRTQNLAVYRKGTIGPQVTAAVAFYYDCTNATAAEGQAFFGCIADNLTAFNVADVIKIEVADNTAGGATLDNWCNSNVFNNIEGYQIYRGLNIIGGTASGNGVFRNTFSNVTFQPGLGTGGSYAPEVITGSGATSVADNVFINCVVWDHPTDVFASAWAKSNLRVGGNTSGIQSPGDINSQVGGVFGGGSRVTSGAVVQAKGIGAYNSSTGQLAVYDLNDTNRRVNVGYDPTLEAGYIQATKSGTANRPLLLNPNGGPLNIFPINGATPAMQLGLVFDYVSNTTIAIRFKGSDNVVRSVNLTLS